MPNYYTYITTDGQRFYIGSRVCHCNIDDDNYMGSHRDKTYSPIVKRVLGVHNHWLDAQLAEAYWHNLFKVAINPLFANQANASWFISKIESLEERKLNGEDNPFYGKTHNERTKKRLSEINTGKIISQETRQKLRVYNTGKVLSEEHKQKIRLSNQGQKRSKEVRQKMSDAKRDKTIYKWIHKDGRILEATHKELYTTFKLNKSSLRGVINGNRKSCGGWSICKD